MINRRNFLKRTTLATTALATGLATGGRAWGGRASGRRKVIVLGLDGMDPILSERLMKAGRLPNCARLAKAGGYRKLRTTTPPQSPVAWGTFITGADPGSHGIFDFIHRDPSEGFSPYYAAARTIPGEGFWEIGDHRMQLTFWPFGHKAASTELCRRGVPFWYALDKAGVESVFYSLPSNYPASSSEFKHHRCLSGLGVPDLLGGYGTYQYFGEDAPPAGLDEPGGKRSFVLFDQETSATPLELAGPMNTFLQKPRPTTIPFVVHRDREARAAAIEIQGRTVLLKEGQWSPWQRLAFRLDMAGPDKSIQGICRFYLQGIEPFRLYVTPINADPSSPAIQLTEPPAFSEQLAERLGLFYTTGIREDHKALSNGIFTDGQFAAQAEMVLQEQLQLLDFALKDYDDGLLFFYFSSTDLQSHMFWWDGPGTHPGRSRSETEYYVAQLGKLYARMDGVLGRILDAYGNEATIIVLSDHGFGNFRRQFDVNRWLAQEGYLQAEGITTLSPDLDWSGIQAYGLGINGLYLNLRGRERTGVVEPTQRQALLDELSAKLLAVRDTDGRPVVKHVHQGNAVYHGKHTDLAPDLVIGYYRGYRASWATVLGGLGSAVLSDNDSAWAADHCADASEMPGVLFANCPIAAASPGLEDMGPSILGLFGLPPIGTMTGRNVFS